MSIIEARRSFIKYVLHHYTIHDKNTVWLFNLMKDKDQILKHLIFKKTSTLMNQLIIFENFKVHLILTHGIYTDSDVIFHYMLNNSQPIYINILFKDKRYDSLCTQEVMNALDFYVMDEEHLDIHYLDEIINFKEMRKDSVEYQYLIDQINHAIEDTLISKNKERFSALSQLKRSIEEM